MDLYSAQCGSPVLLVPEAHVANRASVDRKGPGQQVIEQVRQGCRCRWRRWAGLSPQKSSGARYSGVPAGVAPQAGALAPGAEVHQYHPAAVFAHHVLGLDVAVEQPGGVNRRKGPAKLATDSRDLGRLEHRASAQQFLERSARDELHP